MRVKGFENVWAIGDAAAVPDPAKARQAPCPPTCQHALRQGNRVADNVAASLGAARRALHLQDTWRVRGHGPLPGRGRAVRRAPRGFPAWFAARSYHLLMMPGMSRKLRLMIDWTIGPLLRAGIRGTRAARAPAFAWRVFSETLSSEEGQD